MAGRLGVPAVLGPVLSGVPWYDRLNPHAAACLTSLNVSHCRLWSPKFLIIPRTKAKEIVYQQEAQEQRLSTY